jgi:hypothetical protein
VEDVMPADEPYQLFPDLTTDEYKALREDINVRGVQVPVESDEDGHILDGYHRWKICQELHKACPSVERKGRGESRSHDSEKSSHWRCCSRYDASQWTRVTRAESAGRS